MSGPDNICNFHIKFSSIGVTPTRLDKLKRILNTELNLPSLFTAVYVTSQHSQHKCNINLHFHIFRWGALFGRYAVYFDNFTVIILI